MDYEKKYRKALKKAEAFYYSATTEPITEREVLANIFPELVMSEDEKIKRCVKYAIDKLFLKEKIVCDVHKDDVLAWLEKQENRNTNLCQEDGAVEGYAVTEPEKYFREVSAPIEATEATYTTEVETGDGGIKALVTGKVVMPKFKVGDFIVNDYCMGKVIELTDDAYLLDTGQGIPFSCEHNIDDVKDGDVLQLGVVTAIFKEYIGNGICKCYCSVCNGEFEIPSQDGADNSYGCHNATPATKEQRDTLIKAMTDAGYTFDYEKKELKKIEQKPTWSEEDKRMLQYVVDDLKFVKELVNDPHYVVPVKRVEKEIDWMESLKQRYTWKPSDEHYELEEFAKIVRGNITGISEAVQELFEAKYLQLTGNEMYGGFKN